MRVLKNIGILFGVKKIVIDKNRFITIDGDPFLPPMTIESETHTGFFALKDLEPMFKHMKCWTNHDGEECAACPVKHDGVCGIMGIKDAAEREAIEKSQRHEL
jgi:hypothetical protein